MKYTVKLAFEKEILIEAIEFVRDFEGDMCLELASSLARTKGKAFDDTLTEITELRTNVKVAEGLLGRFKAPFSENVSYMEINLSHPDLEVIKRGLEYLQDTLSDRTTEALWELQQNAKDAESESVTLTLEQIIKMRETVERIIDRSEGAKVLLAEFRSMLK